MDFGTIATELYALPLGQFTRARNDRAGEASRSGQKDLTALLRKLPKPSTAAWLVNLLVTHRRGEVEQVIELGGSLREAQEGSDRAQLHALGQQRQRLLAAVARQSLDVAGEVGYDVGPAALGEVEATLRAAMTDPAAAAAVLTARLVRTLEVSGWEPVSVEGAVGGPFEACSGDVSPDSATGTAGSRRKKSGTDESGSAEQLRLLEQARADLGRAEAEAERADDAVRKAGAHADRVGVKREGIKASIEDLQERLAALGRELDGVEEEAREAERHRHASAEEAAEAHAAVQSARETVADAG